MLLGAGPPAWSPAPPAANGFSGWAAVGLPTVHEGTCSLADDSGSYMQKLFGTAEPPAAPTAVDDAPAPRRWRRAGTRCPPRAACLKGTVAVQLACHWGARVLGTASDRNHNYLRSLGAEPVAYGPGLAKRVRAVAPEGITVALDCIGGDAVPVSIELAGGPERVGTIADQNAITRYGVRRPGGERSAAKLAELVRLHSEGHLRITVQAAFPLLEASAAHREVESGHVRGKVVLVGT